MDPKERHRLIARHAPLVKSVVGRMTARLAIDPADRDDLVQVGIMGLMGALEKFDPQRNVQFETYARHRIRGAVLDELRARDWVPRSARSKDNRIEKALASLQKTLGRAPESSEIAVHMGISLEEYYQMLDDAKGISLICSEDLPPDFLERCRPEDILDAADEGTPFDLLSDRETKRRLREAIERLPEREKLVLSLYYFEDLTMKEVGRVLDLTESRVCQLHAQAVFRLRGSVAKQRGLREDLGRA